MNAIELGDPEEALLWYTLGHIVAREGPVVVNDITYSTKEECDAKAKQTHRSTNGTNTHSFVIAAMHALIQLFISTFYTVFK